MSLDCETMAPIDLNSLRNTHCSLVWTSEQYFCRDFERVATEWNCSSISVSEERVRRLSYRNTAGEGQKVGRRARSFNVTGTNWKLLDKQAQWQARQHLLPRRTVTESGLESWTWLDLSLHNVKATELDRVLVYIRCLGEKCMTGLTNLVIYGRMQADLLMGINPLKASSSQSAISEEELTKGIRALTDDSVYELYAPDKGVPIGVEVIFFHGLPLDEDYKNAYWKTWLSRDGSKVWPKEWLPGSLSNPRILSVSYDASAREHDGAQDSYSIVERLIRDLILDKGTQVGQNCPVVLIGHSLGGIIIKEFLLKCLTMRGIQSNNENAQAGLRVINKFVENCKGVFYFSTPHHGSEFIDYLKGKRIALNGPLMELLSVLSSLTARKNSEFANVRYCEGFRTQAIGESLNTEYMGFKKRIVEEASARHDIETYYTGTGENHFDVCKPKNEISCSIFKQLLEFINQAIADKRPGLRDRIIPEDSVTMGNRGSTSHSARPEGQDSEINQRPTEIDRATTKLNDSVYRLYSPQDVPGVVVIFFHGLPQENDHTEAYLKTWLTRDSKEVWPKEWLPEMLPSPQILSVSYDSCPVPKYGGATDAYVIAENLIQDIILDDQCKLNQDCPVILVGHSLGGIIIRELLLACWKREGQSQNKESAQKDLKRLKKFRENCKGVFYYSTPNHGSIFFNDLSKKSKSLNGLMKLLSVLSSETERINSNFANARPGEEIKTRAIRETRDTTYMGFEGQLVEEASAMSDIDDGKIYAVDADHFDVCKPTDRMSNIFRHLVRFILTAIPQTPQIEQLKQIELMMTIEHSDRDSDPDNLC